MRRPFKRTRDTPQDGEEGPQEDEDTPLRAEKAKMKAQIPKNGQKSFGKITGEGNQYVLPLKPALKKSNSASARIQASPGKDMKAQKPKMKGNEGPKAQNVRSQGMTCHGGPGGNRASVGQSAPKTKARP